MVKISFYLCGYYLNNKLFREYQYSSENELIMAFEYQYDATGRLLNRLFLESLQIPSDSPTAGIEREYIYNDQGQLTQEKTYDPYFGYSYGEVTRYAYYE